MYRLKSFIQNLHRGYTINHPVIHHQQYCYLDMPCTSFTFKTASKPSARKAKGPPPPAEAVLDAVAAAFVTASDAVAAAFVTASSDIW